MSVFTTTIIVALGLLVGLLVLLEVGRRVGQRQRAAAGDASNEGLGALSGAVFGLMGLLVAFTFSSAATKFDWRRSLIAQEANSVGTAWLRIDLLPTAEQPGFREKFRTYLDERLASYRAMPDVTKALFHAERATALQSEIWTDAVRATSGDHRASTLLLPAINDMIDITTTRMMATKTHPPVVIFGLLIAVALACALLAGHGLGGRTTRSWLHMIAFAVILAFSVYVILDLEFPRIGLIRLDAADEVLTELRRSML